jgi:large subunit ribosomal protein L40e
MGKFPEADAMLSNIMVCRKCKTRNKRGMEKCRKCGSKFLRPKRKEIRAKK